MKGANTVTEFTRGLLAWLSDLAPNATCALVEFDPRDGGHADETAADKVRLCLASISPLPAPRSAIHAQTRLSLGYQIHVAGSTPIETQSLLETILFALLDRDDLSDGEAGCTCQGNRIDVRLLATRSRPIPAAPPVRSVDVQLSPNRQIRGRVCNEKKVAIAGAQIHVHGTERLIVTDRHGVFQATVPGEQPIRATVSARGRSAEVELNRTTSNDIIIAMEN